MGTEILTLTAYAKRVGVSQQRMSQLKAQGVLDDCFKMKGRTCLIDVERADTRLRSDLDPGQPRLKARPPLSTRRQPKPAEPKSDLAEWCERMNAALYEIYTLAEVLIEPQKSMVRDHMKSISDTLNAE